jgi:FlgD Ig-like domain
VNDDDGGLDRGAIYILFLSRAGRVLSQQKISNLQGNFGGALDDGDEFGGSLASLGDLDGAGPSAAALAVGAVYDDDGGLERGAVYILFLDTSGTVHSSTKISSTSLAMLGALGDDDNFGEDVASLGDLDGAGPSVRALAVGAVGDDDGGTAHGAVYILFLNSAGTVLSRQKISDTQGLFLAPLAADDNLGSAVTWLGDLDGAGPSVAALAVGAGSRDGLGLDRGATYILFLTAAGTVSSYQELSSTSGNFDGALDDGDEFGSGLAALGDLDGSGVGAMAMACGVGYDDDDGPDRGAVYVMILADAVLVGVGDRPTAGRDAGLGLARPSVFAHRTVVPFHLGAQGRVRIEIWDAGGRLVRRLLDEERGPGEHQAVWDGSDDAGRASSPGAYFMRMSVDGRSVGGATKALLLR